MPCSRRTHLWSQKSNPALTPRPGVSPHSHRAPTCLDSAFPEGHSTNRLHKVFDPACHLVQSSCFTNEDTAAAKGGNSARLQLVTELETLGLAPSTDQRRLQLSTMSQNSSPVMGSCASAPGGPQESGGPNCLV